MSELLPGNHWRESEFITIGGVARNGACGPNALAMAESYANQAYTWTGTIYQRMAAAGRLSASDGASTIYQLAAQAGAGADGFKTALLGFNLAGLSDWFDWFIARLGENAAVIMETGNGQALIDSISGKGENAKNLVYHFITILGYFPGGYSSYAGRNLPAGFWCADGCNYAGGNVLQFYPTSVIAAAKPSAALAIYLRVAIPTTPSPATGGSGNMGIPSGWTDANGVLTGPASGLDGKTYPFVGGMRQHALAMLASGVMPADDMALEAEHFVTSDRIEQMTNYHLLVFVNNNGSWGFFCSNIGASLFRMRAQALADASTISDLNNQIAGLNAALATANADLAAAKAATGTATDSQAQSSVKAYITALAGLQALAQAA